MDKTTQENWTKLKQTLEDKEQTDTAFYKRAVAISNGDPDPLMKLLQKHFEDQRQKPH